MAPGASNNLYTKHLNNSVPALIRGIQVRVRLLNKKTAAMALYPFILLNRKKSAGRVLINHERIHLAQQLEMLILPFYILYVLELLFRGYRNISFEKEAYTNEHNLNYLKERRPYSWVRYWS
jgi:hypothetical protein